jgi:methyl-accepting chemotaxis protein
MKIKTKLPAFISVIVIIPVIVISLFIYFYNSRVMTTQSKEEITFESKLAKLDVEEMINGQKKEAELIASNKYMIDAAKRRLQMMGDDFFSSKLNASANAALKSAYDKLTDHEHLFLIDTKGEIFADSNPATLKINVKDRKYFKDGMDGQESISDTVISKVDGRSIVVFSAPVKDESGKVVAVVANSVYTDFFCKNLSNIKIGKTGYAYMVDASGIVLSHPDKSKVSKPVENDLIKKVVSRIKNGEAVNDDVAQYTYNGIPKLTGYAVISGTKWTLALVQDMSEVNASTVSMEKMIIIVGAITLILAILIGIYFSKGITGPINNLIKIMSKAADGDTTVRSSIATRDEIGELSSSFNIMTESLSNIIKGIKEHSKNVEDQSVHMSNASKEIAASSGSVTNSIQEVAKGTESQSQDLIAITSIMNSFGTEIESIGKSIREIDASIKDINNMAEHSDDKMSMLGESVNKVTSSFKEFINKFNNLDNNITKINEITDVMNSIADQTNLLALNAAIEAARVGESGRGFAVVADEIRKLAEQSKTSSEAINDLINNISNDAKLMVETSHLMDGEFKEQVETINASIEAFRNITEAVTNVSPKVEEVNNYAASINTNKNNIIDRIENVSSIAEEVSASVEEIAATSEEVNASTEEVAQSADELNKMTNIMLEGTNKFIV